MQDTEHRLTELEIRLAWQDDLLEDLNLTLARQQRQIELMQQQLCRLYAMLNQSAPATGEPGSLLAQLQQDIPPHY